MRVDRRPDPEFLPDADREIGVRPQRHRAFVTIMRGCDHVCTYCIVPFTRGREVSRPLDEVLVEVGRLAADGVREVTFLGQNINTYGKDRPDEGGLCALLERTAAGDGDRPHPLPDQQPLRHDRGHDAALRGRAEGHALAPHPRAVRAPTTSCAA